MVNKVKGKLEELARERTQLNGEKAALLSEKEHLKAQVTDLAAAVQKINREKVMLENTLEAEEEQVCFQTFMTDTGTREQLRCHLCVSVAAYARPSFMSCYFEEHVLSSSLDNT